MKIVYRANDATSKELVSRGLPPGAQWVAVGAIADFSQHPDADLFIDLASDDPALPEYDMLKPTVVLVNAVIATLHESAAAPNVYRINAWPGMLSQPLLELAAPGQQTTAQLEHTLVALQWKYRFVPDTAGLVSARIISMIINEAYFALGEGVSSKENIDIAMKTGTNYPYGPFEWAAKIGLQRIQQLLVQMQKENNRYSIAPALLKDLEQPA